MINQDAQYWVEHLQLTAHPEGGYFREIYRSSELITASALPARYEGDHAFTTSIYFLLTDAQFSAFHRLKSDEIWHFYGGTSLTLYIINPDGELKQIQLGNRFENGEHFQVIVEANQWFAAKVNQPNSYALVGCTVAPGFDFSDFELANRKELISQYPHHQKLITQLTHK